MTSLNETENGNHVNGCSPLISNGQEQSSNETQQMKSISTVSKTETVDTTDQTEEKQAPGEDHNNENGTNRKRTMNTIEDDKQQLETADYRTDHESRPRKFNTKIKFPSVSPNRLSYFTNGNPYGTGPYYYYATSETMDKPAPLMFLPTQTSTSSAAQSLQIPSGESVPSSNDSPIGNAINGSTQNLPPRLRQGSSTEHESNHTNGTGNGATGASSSSQTSYGPTNGNHRRHRSILPRGYATYYAQHPPPPLMATPPGVLYPYPPTIHPTGHIAYNIRSPDDFDYYNYATQYLGIPPVPYLWSPSSQSPLPGIGDPSYPVYPINELSPDYMFDTVGVAQNLASPLNPEAAEWVPPVQENDSDTSDSKIMLDDEIDFPPLNGGTQTSASGPTINKDQPDEIPEMRSSPTESSPATNDDVEQVSDEMTISTITTNPKLEPTGSSTSSQDETNTNLIKSSLSSSPTKVTSISYSTVILQTSDNQKTQKNSNMQTPSSQRRTPISQLQPTQTAAKERPIKVSSNQQQQQPQRANTPTQNNHKNDGRRHQATKINLKATKTAGPEMNSSHQHSQQQQSMSSSTVVDEWIEVRSKKTKKFDRSIIETLSEKAMSDEKSITPTLPTQLTPTTRENTATSLTSEDDVEDKEHVNLSVIMHDDNNTNDYNRSVIDGIHTRLNHHEHLLILMRGCPGSGKSTLARAINHGYNGIILSADNYFVDSQTNEYEFDANKLAEAHQINHKKTSDALKRKINPIIIDNTNTQAWEMRPYITMGKEAGYEILLVEPQTPWRYKPRELSKRNCHNLPLKRIREMLNRFEHDADVQGMINKSPQGAKVNGCPSTIEAAKISTDNETTDNVLASKKLYEIIDDQLILDEVRLCINDMILFLTSQFYQTALSSYTSILTNTTTTTTTTSQSSTPLSVSFHDLSLLSSTSVSLPTTPTASHSRFHRPIPRFSSTTTQEHVFNTEHFLRMPSTFTRCFDSINSTHFTPILATQTSVLGKKRRKNKTKSSPDNQVLVNTNNNNNNMDDAEDNTSTSVMNGQFNVYLAEECPDFVVIEEQQNNDWLGQAHKNFGIQINRAEVHKSVPSKKSKLITHPNTSQLMNILHHELNSPSVDTKEKSMVSLKHAEIQCSFENFDLTPNSSDRILFGRLSMIPTAVNVTIQPAPGFNECGIQVDLNEPNLDTLNHLIEIYSNCVSVDTIQQFFNVCQGNFQWARTQIEDYLKHPVVVIPTLYELALNALEKWNEEIKSVNPTFDTICLDDLLQDINDEEISHDMIMESQSNSIEFIDNGSISLPWPVVNSLEELYGDLTDKSFFSSNQNGIVLPIDDELSISIYQALERCNMKSFAKESSNKPVTDNQRKTQDKSNNNQSIINQSQRWMAPDENQSNKNVQPKNVPSLRQIIEEEKQAQKSKKPNLKKQLDYATEYKLRELEHQYPSLDPDMIFEMFRENEYNYEITLACICSILDEDASIPVKPKIHSRLPSLPSSQSIPATKINIEPVLDSYETLRCDAVRHAQRRKEYYDKARQANRHGMAGVVSFYIHQASEQTRLMKSANQAACERLSRWRLAEFYQTNKLDLHGLHTDEALQLFKLIEQQLNEGNRRTTPKTIEIITGYGKRSVYGGGDGKIRLTILSYIQQKNYKYSEPNRGAILLQFVNNRNC